MRERQLIDAIHRRLPKSIHKQGMTGATMATNGTPDYYYDLAVEGQSGQELWVEYKQLSAMPRSGIAVGAFTPLQLRWMERRYNNSLYLPHGPNVVGVVGLPNRTAVIQRSPTEWREGTHVTNAISLEEIAKWIIGFCSQSSSSSEAHSPAPQLSTAPIRRARTRTA